MDAGCPAWSQRRLRIWVTPVGVRAAPRAPSQRPVQAGQLVACARPEYRVRALPVFTPKGTWRHLAHLVWLWLTVIPHR